MAPLEGVYGRYTMGDRHILLDERLPAALAYAVRVHEMMHYLQWKHGRWKFTQESKCENEREAFGISNGILRRLHDDKNVVEWDRLRGAYGCA